MENLKTLAEIFYYIITPIALIIGGIWAYRNFWIRKEHLWNADLKVCSSILKQGAKNNVVLVNVSIKNIGNKRITPTKNGLTITVFKSKNNKSENSIVSDWKEIKGIQTDILSIYKPEEATYDNYYNIDPGAQYNEKSIIKLKDKGTYMLKCKFHIKDKKHKEKENTLVEYDFIVVE